MALDMCLRPVVTEMLLYRHEVNGCILNEVVHVVTCTHIIERMQMS